MENKKDYISISKFVKIIINNIKIVIIAVIAATILMFILSSFVIPKQYISNVSLYVNNNVSDSKEALNINDITASQKLVNTYKVIIKDNEVLNQVCSELLDKYSISYLEEYLSLETVNGKQTITPDSLRPHIKLSSIDDTEVLRIQVETNNAKFSAELCQIIANSAPDSIKRIVKAGSVEIIGHPTVANKKSFPSVKLFSFLGALGGFLIAIVVIFIKFFFSDKVLTSQDIINDFDVSFLGDTPDFTNFKEDSKSAYKL